MGRERPKADIQKVTFGNGDLSGNCVFRTSVIIANIIVVSSLYEYNPEI